MFYSLQGAGLYYDGVSPRHNIYNTAVRSGLVYGCHTIYLSRLDLIKLNKAQAKYVRTALGLRSYCHVKPVFTSSWDKTDFQFYSIILYRSVMGYSSKFCYIWFL